MGHWPTKENRQNCSTLFIFWPMDKLPEMAANGARRICFLIIQTWPTFWATWILILRTFMCWDFCWIRDFQISKSLDFQIPGSWNQVPGYGWLRLGGAPVDGTPGPQTSGDPRKLGNTVRTPLVQPCLGNYASNVYRKQTRLYNFHRTIRILRNGGCSKLLQISPEIV